MRTPIAPALLALLVFAAIAVGCNRDGPASDGAPTTEVPAPAVADDQDADGAADAGVTMRYACDGQRVAVFGQDHASVTLADGRVVELAYASGSSPPRFSGEALEFSVAADGAVLAQDGLGQGEGTTWACTPE